jgi:hypothetical protein
MMNLVEHALAAVAIQAVIGLTTRNWWIGAALASGYFLGREVAQAEYRWIEQFGDGLRANLLWRGALGARLWVQPEQVAGGRGCQSQPHPGTPTGMTMALPYSR